MQNAKKKYFHIEQSGYLDTFTYLQENEVLRMLIVNVVLSGAQYQTI